MQFTTLALSVAALASLAQGYRISNCREPGDFNLGNDECHNWTDAQYSYQSDAGCTLTFYAEENCLGESRTTTTQNQCLNVGISSRSMRCT